MEPAQVATPRTVGSSSHRAPGWGGGGSRRASPPHARQRPAPPPGGPPLDLCRKGLFLRVSEVRCCVDRSLHLFVYSFDQWLLPGRALRERQTQPHGQSGFFRGPGVGAWLDALAGACPRRPGRGGRQGTERFTGMWPAFAGSGPSGSPARRLLRSWPLDCPRQGRPEHPGHPRHRAGSAASGSPARASSRPREELSMVPGGCLSKGHTYFFLNLKYLK